MEKTETLTHYFRSSVRRMFSGLMLSRLSGFGRDLAMAHAFGDHPVVATFFVAFRLANVFRRFLGEGPLQSTFIPQFEDLRKQDVQKAYTFFQTLTFLIGGLICVLVGLSEMGIHLTFRLWSADTQSLLVFIKWILPSLFFISLYGLNTSFLQCHNRFFIPNVAPVLCNGMWILGALTLKNLPVDQAMLGIAKCVTLGFIIQWMLTFFQMLRQIGSQKWIVFNLFNSEIKKLSKAFSLGLIGVSASQLNTFIDVIFARYSHASAPVYLWYATRFQHLSLALFGITIVNTLVPILSRAIKEGKETYAKKIFSFGARRMIAFSLSMTFAICVLGFSAIDFVFGRGRFTLYAVEQTAYCLAAYGIGLLPATLVLFDSAILYAKGNFKTPTLLSTLAIAFHLGLNAYFVFVLGLGAISTALSTSLSAWGNCLVLRWLLRKKGWKVGFQKKEWGLLFGSLCIATVLTYRVGGLFSDKLYQFFIPGTVFVAALGALWVLCRKSFLNNRSSQASTVLVKDY